MLSFFYSDVLPQRHLVHRPEVADLLVPRSRQDRERALPRNQRRIARDLRRRKSGPGLPLRCETTKRAPLLRSLRLEDPARLRRWRLILVGVFFLSKQTNKKENSFFLWKLFCSHNKAQILYWIGARRCWREEIEETITYSQGCVSRSSSGSRSNRQGAGRHGVRKNAGQLFGFKKSQCLKTTMFSPANREAHWPSKSNGLATGRRGLSGTSKELSIVFRVFSLIFRDGSLISSSSSQYSQTFDGTYSRLNIRRLESSTTGSYKCHAKSEYGENNTTIQVSMEESGQGTWIFRVWWNDWHFGWLPKNSPLEIYFHIFAKSALMISDNLIDLGGHHVGHQSKASSLETEKSDEVWEQSQREIARQTKIASSFFRTLLLHLQIRVCELSREYQVKWKSWIK